MKSFMASILKSFEAQRLANAGKYDEAKRLMIGR
tara:strand:+ start:1018 stop:1119 length:102 start_codon:yes stop_codon:yes gene_type:complete